MPPKERTIEQILEKGHANIRDAGRVKQALRPSAGICMTLGKNSRAKARMAGVQLEGE